MRKLLSITIATIFVTASLAKAQTDDMASPSPSPSPAAAASPSPSATPKVHKAKKSPTPAASPAATVAGKTGTKVSPSPEPSATPKKKKAKASPSPSASPAASATPKKAKSSASATPAPGGGPGLVWVNTETKIYHKQGSKWYGTTKKGKYMKEADAIKEGDKAGSN